MPIALANGMVITTYPVPPASLDLEKVTDRERAKYGIPRFPHGTEFDKRWKEMAPRLRFVEPVFTQRERRRKPKNELPDVKSSHGPQTNSNWSGAITTGTPETFFTGEPIRSVGGSWNIPDVSLPTGAQSGLLHTASTWVGIDGWNSYDILQAGCDSDVISFVQPSFCPWFEWYPAVSYWITSLPVSAGDEFWCFIVCFGDYFAHSAAIFLGNLTTGLVLPFIATAPSPWGLQGTSAEWIVEAPFDINHRQIPLAKYTPVIFKSCICCTADGQLIDVATGVPREKERPPEITLPRVQISSPPAPSGLGGVAVVTA